MRTISGAYDRPETEEYRCHRRTEQHRTESRKSHDLFRGRPSDLLGAPVYERQESTDEHRVDSIEDRERENRHPADGFYSDRKLFAGRRFRSEVSR